MIHIDNQMNFLGYFLICMGNIVAHHSEDVFFFAGDERAGWGGVGWAGAGWVGMGLGALMFESEARWGLHGRHVR